MALALSTAKFSDLPLHRPLLPFRFLSLSLSVRFSPQGPSPNPRFLHRASKTPSAPWLHQWDSPSPPPPPENSKPSHSPSSSIDRIVHRLRNLELGMEVVEHEQKVQPASPLNGDEKLADLLQRSWTRPDLPSDSDRTAVLPWERRMEYTEEEEEKGRKKRRVRAPSLAELTIEDEELRRLRRMGMVLRERINVPKAGVTKEVLENIHDGWRKSELVRLKFHEDLAHDMRTAHEIVEV